MCTSLILTEGQTAAEVLDFELAAQIRDRVIELKNM
ncbi:TPA: UvrB/UvrC motif-containing protein [Streptococcus suis]|nr:UvrB/UvrC motif-containing protein [Streptococcus suis]